MSRALAALVLCIAVAVSARGAPVAEAPPTLPTTFYGSVTLDGSPAPDGVTISARSGLSVLATATVFSSGWLSGLYRIDVPCAEGAAISFSAAASALSPSASCAPGSVVQLDLNGSAATATSTATATLTASPTTSPTAGTTASPMATSTATATATRTATATQTTTPERRGRAYLPIVIR